MQQRQPFQGPMANANFTMQLPSISFGVGSQFGGGYAYGRHPSYYPQTFISGQQGFYNQGFGGGFSLGGGFGGGAQYETQYGNPALRHFEQPHTMPGGRFSFNPVNSGGGQMYIGGTPGFYDAPMGGGASGGFSFGM